MTYLILTNPLEQFEIRDLIFINAPLLGNLNLSLTNIVLYLITSFAIIFTFSSIINQSRKLVFNNWTLTNETLYDTIHGIVTSQINKFNGQVYFPFIYTLFIFILINNLIGLVPYSFATTSHIVLTFSLSFTIVLGVTILGFKIHNLKFFSFFVPAGCPLALLPALVLIEFISYLARNVSLGLRLGANILSGHMLLNILSGFTYKIMSTGVLFFIIGLLPLSFIIAFSSLELGIAFIQAQVFVVLTCSYIKDALDLH
jgi:F-type H+-transporting ATPase subunit a